MTGTFLVWKGANLCSTAKLYKAVYFFLELIFLQILRTNIKIATTIPKFFAVFLSFSGVVENFLPKSLNSHLFSSGYPPSKTMFGRCFAFLSISSELRFAYSIGFLEGAIVVYEPIELKRIVVFGFSSVVNGTQNKYQPFLTRVGIKLFLLSL